MKIKELYEIPGLEEVFNQQGRGNYVQFLKNENSYYFNIDERVFGPFDSLQESIKFLASHFLKLYENRDDLITSIQKAIKGAIDE